MPREALSLGQQNPQLRSKGDSRLLVSDELTELGLPSSSPTGFSSDTGACGRAA